MGRFTIAGLCVLVALCWQYITVSVNYRGNWTALFCTGGLHRLPPELDDEDIYRFPDSHGFDAQFYHLIAHEPIPGEMLPYIEAPETRYRRILLPGMAYLMSAGRERVIHFCYVTAGFLFLFLGLWWLGGYVTTSGLSEWWLVLFVVLPASLVFIDRLTLDHVLAALCVGYALYAIRRPSWQLYVILTLAPLAREIGILLTISYLFYCTIWRNWRFAALFATTTIPSLLWNLYIQLTIGSAAYSTETSPLSSLFHFLLNPVEYSPEVPLASVVRFADAVALLGMLLAIVFAILLVWKRKTDPIAVSALLFALLAIFVQRPDVWATVYNYGRIFSPLLILVAVGWLPQNRWLGALPILLTAPRVAIQYGRQIMGVMDAIAGIY